MCMGISQGAKYPFFMEPCVESKMASKMAPKMAAGSKKASVKWLYLT